ncbi:MAG: hypothetical protein FJ034_05380 [Chloroflexi bacterium]|nr:hypothetical protein [Chloroflexota bacterium]
MPAHPTAVARRIVPDPVAVQILVASLLGDGRLVGPPLARRLRIVERADREAYARWKYDRLGALAAGPPRREGGAIVLDTIAHPILDDLAAMQVRGCARDVLGPLGFAVWLADAGRTVLVVA